MIFCENPKEKHTWFKLLQETVKAAKSIKMRKEDDEEMPLELTKLPLDPVTITEKELRALVSRLLGTKGITIKNRKLKLKTYKNCFVGKDLVTWLYENKIAEDRKKAEQIGQKLIEFNYMKHAAEENGALKDDANSPYRFHNVSMDQDKTRRGRSTSHGPDSARSVVKPDSARSIVKSQPAGADGSVKHNVGVPIATKNQISSPSLQPSSSQPSTSPLGASPHRRAQNVLPSFALSPHRPDSDGESQCEEGSKKDEDTNFGVFVPNME